MNQQIIMNFSVPPSPDDLVVMANEQLENLPDELTKAANDDDVIILYRRSILDLWCETGENLNQIVRDAMIEEIGNHFDFSEDEIEEMSQRHYQGML